MYENTVSLLRKPEVVFTIRARSLSTIQITVTMKTGNC